MFVIKKVVVLVVLFLSTFLVVTPDISVADTQQSKKVEQKREQIRKKINSLSKLERQETNKLSKNQQKLEKNQKALLTSQRQYDQKQKNINPLFVSAFNRAGDLAIAMECRCYHGGDGRTRMTVRHIRFVDFIPLFLVILLGGALIALNILGIGFTLS